MNGFSRGGRPNHCHGCQDRVTACSDHCQKPDFLKWKHEQEVIRENRRAYYELAGYISDNAQKNNRRGHGG